ncbi:MAG TPA: HAMP domain-containing sensor histidine kinase [Chitinophagaceae bacterium]|nr:HAMP domain-containing sensor histidine kinase [Chitinophagaceae bacterium]
MQLLQKTIRSYFILSAILLALAIPAFYFTLKTLMINTIDEDLVAVKSKVMPQLLAMVANQNSGNMEYPGYNIIYEKEQPVVSTGDSIYTVNVSATRLLASHFSVNKTSYNLQIKTSLINKMSLIKRIVAVLAIILVLLLAGLLLINRMLTRKIWEPFYNTLKKLQDYRVDKQRTLVLAKAPVKEFNDLNDEITRLTERNYQVYASQKEFAENASHEMQSPLAVFQSKLELLMQTQPLNEEQAALITDLANAGQRMSRLNKGLVLLTKIENNQYIETENISIKSMTEKLLQQYQFQVEKQSIHVTFNVEDDVVLAASRTLMEILLGNLISNAIRHNVQQGYIIITIKDNRLVIQNSGKQSSLDTQKLFQRFHKESDNANSIGLGLEIVKKICTLNHYAIQYSYQNQAHTFSVQF